MGCFPSPGVFLNIPIFHVYHEQGKVGKRKHDCWMSCPLEWVDYRLLTQWEADFTSFVRLVLEIHDAHDDFVAAHKNKSSQWGISSATDEMPDTYLDEESFNPIAVFARVYKCCDVSEFYFVD